MRRLPLLAPLALAVVSASALTSAGCGCEKDRQVLEVMYDETYDLYQDFLQAYKDRGYRCTDDGTIRDAFGHALGTRYVCTGCP